MERDIVREVRQRCKREALAYTLPLRKNGGIDRHSRGHTCTRIPETSAHPLPNRIIVSLLTLGHRLGAPQRRGPMGGRAVRRRRHGVDETDQTHPRDLRILR